jgi:hypothetical protein
MSSLALYCFGSAAVCALIFGPLALLWAKSCSPWRFLLSAALVWTLIGTLPVSARSWEEATFPADPSHFLATMIWAVPFIAVTLALAWPVAAGASRRVILLASLAASLVAAPISILSGLYGACSLGDCV